MREGHCSCGALRITTPTDPIRVTACHCHECQRRTGNVFGVQARFAEADIQVEGEYQTYVRGSEFGDIMFHFCSNCGGTVFYHMEGMPDMVGVPVGVFADATFPAPSLSIYEERIHPWVKLPESCQHFD